MNRALLVSAAFATWVIGSLELAHAWVTNPGIFPTLPMPLWHWLDKMYRSLNAEEVADLEFFVVLTSSSIILLSCFAALFFIWHQLQKKR